MSNAIRTFTLTPDAWLYQADCRDVLRALPENSIDSVVTDPPYHLTSVVKRFGGANAAPAKHGTDGLYARQSAGFMGKQWDGGDIAFDPAMWAEVLRVLKPGAHLVAFGASKNFGFMQVALNEAGFEIRDVLAWMFGQGFPKSKNQQGEWKGYGSALKPGYEPILLCRKPLSEGTIEKNLARWRTGALNIDACRVGYTSEADKRLETRGVHGSTKEYVGLSEDGGAFGGLPAGRVIVAPNEGGRWPANVVTDGSAEVIEAFPQTSSGSRNGQRKARQSFGEDGTFAERERDTGYMREGDSGSAARFFYSAKANKTDRAGSKHPTIKPVSLMKWLTNLVTPPGGCILDPFAGSGTTGQAALENGFRCMLVEREQEYVADIQRRIAQMKKSDAAA